MSSLEAIDAQDEVAEELQKLAEDRGGLDAYQLYHFAIGSSEKRAEPDFPDHAIENIIRNAYSKKTKAAHA